MYVSVEAKDVCLTQWGQLCGSGWGQTAHLLLALSRALGHLWGAWETSRPVHMGLETSGNLLMLDVNTVKVEVPFIR